MALTDASSRTSTCTNSARPDRASMAAHVLAAACSLRAHTATCAPARAKASAVARPMPEVPPVTSATLPAKSYRIMHSLLTVDSDPRLEPTTNHLHRLTGEALSALGPELLAQGV